MKHTILILALLLSACGAKDIATLKSKPAIHRTVTAHGDYHAVYERIRAKILECGNPAQYPQPFFDDTKRQLIEVPIGTVDGMAFYYSVQDNSNGTSTVEVYSNFKIGSWPDTVEMVVRGALGQEGCP